MTLELLKSICAETEGAYQLPELNERLFLHHKGFRRIEALEEYVNCRALYLECNGIARIEGLDRLGKLCNLFLQQNCIEKIENLEYTCQIQNLNLSNNSIRKVEGLGSLKKLENLNLANNMIEDLEGLEVLKETKSLRNINVSHNRIYATEGVVEFWSQFKHEENYSLVVLYYHHNPGVREISNYRKRMISSMLSLKYLDDRPIFEIERRSANAWNEGGNTAALKARQEYHKEQVNAYKADPEWEKRKKEITRRRQMTIERLDREAKQREEEQRLLMETGRTKQGWKVFDPQAQQEQEERERKFVEDYQSQWSKKLDRDGIEMIRSDVAAEARMSGSGAAVGPSLDQLMSGAKTSADIRPEGLSGSFNPPPRAAVSTGGTITGVAGQTPGNGDNSSPSSGSGFGGFDMLSALDGSGAVPNATPVAAPSRAARDEDELEREAEAQEVEIVADTGTNLLPPAIFSDVAATSPARPAFAQNQTTGEEAAEGRKAPPTSVADFRPSRLGGGGTAGGATTCSVTEAEVEEQPYEEIMERQIAVVESAYEEERVTGRERGAKGPRAAPVVPPPGGSTGPSQEVFRDPARDSSAQSSSPPPPSAGTSTTKGVAELSSGEVAAPNSSPAQQHLGLVGEPVGKNTPAVASTVVRGAPTTNSTSGAKGVVKEDPNELETLD